MKNIIPFFKGITTVLHGHISLLVLLNRQELLFHRETQSKLNYIQAQVSQKSLSQKTDLCMNMFQIYVPLHYFDNIMSKKILLALNRLRDCLKR